jgi:hypothetical protein
MCYYTLQSNIFIKVTIYLNFGLRLEIFYK